MNEMIQCNDDTANIYNEVDPAQSDDDVTRRASPLKPERPESLLHQYEYAETVMNGQAGSLELCSMAYQYTEPKDGVNGGKSENYTYPFDTVRSKTDINKSEDGDHDFQNRFGSLKQGDNRVLTSKTLKQYSDDNVYDHTTDTEIFFSENIYNQTVRPPVKDALNTYNTFENLGK